ncbi:MAG: Crp/Fnr family transcriptional regulator [Fretibacterium sp.]|nr:Crp/Fnr family transcriptional regulator [Fretibacterium sp.]
MEESRGGEFMNEAEMQTVILSGLFEGMEAEEAEDLLLRLRPQRSSFDRDEIILNSGECPRFIGMLLSGTANVLREDFWGRQRVLSSLEPGDIFAEEYALLPGVPMETSVLAVTPSEVLFLDVEQILRPSGEELHAFLIENLLAMVARKNLLLSRQKEILSKRTIRERLLTYLSAESFHRGLARFEIPFSRQELADHLSVDRSALSNEISKMKDDGVIDCQRRTFLLPAKEVPMK